MTFPTLPIKRLFRVVSGSTPESGDAAAWDGDIVWVTPEDLGKLQGRAISASRRTLSQHGYQSCATTLVPAGSVVLSTRAPIGHVAIAGRDLCTNQGCKALRSIREVNTTYAYYALLDARPRLRSLGQGSTFQELGADRLGSFEIPVPPLREQCAIANFLDRKTVAIDDLIAKKDRLIELLREKRQALITQAVTKGLDPKVPMKESGIPWIGKVPSNWKIVAVKRMAKAGRRTFTDGDWIESPFITEEGVRLIQTGNVGIGRYKEQGFRYVSAQTFHDLRCTEVEPGDVLICRLDGPVGRACLAPDLGVRMITSVDNAILKPRSDCDGRYLVYVLSTPKYLDWVQVLCRVGGGFRFRVSRSMLGDIQIPVPPGDEQRRIADLLDQQTQRSLLVEAKLEAHCEKLCEYRQALITAAVTGKIDVSKEAA